MKDILVDTNIVIRGASSQKFFEKFLNYCNLKGLTIAICDAVKFEFLRGANRKSTKEEIEKALNIFRTEDFSMPISKDIYLDAITLSQLYTHKGIPLKQISFLDCVIGATLKKYENKLLLATMDLNDFPLSIFDRVDIFTFDDGEVSVVGIYKFNCEKFEKVLANFNKS
ncbi:MAG: type II toxin-antitoxin system VapC family toxin [Patescibacteria group bacterium]